MLYWEGHNISSMIFLIIIQESNHQESKHKTNSNQGIYYKITDMYYSKCQVLTTDNFQINLHLTVFYAHHICKFNSSSVCLTSVKHTQNDLMYSSLSIFSQVRNWLCHIQSISKYNPLYPLNIFCMHFFFSIPITGGLIRSL